MNDVNEQGLLPLSEEKPAAESIYILSSNYTLPAFLARGACLAPVCGERGEIEFLDGFFRSFAKGVDTFPREWSQSIEICARNAFPIAVKLRSEGLKKMEFADGGAPVEYFHVDDVMALVFRNEEEQERFASWPFDNYSLDVLGLSMEVDPALFDGPKANEGEAENNPLLPPSQSASMLESDPISGNEPVFDEALRKADAVSGVQAVFLKEIPSRRRWMATAAACFGGNQSGAEAFVIDWPGKLLACLDYKSDFSIETIEDLLLSEVVELLASYPLEEGWVVEDVLGRIYVGATNKIEELDRHDLTEKLRIWADRAGALLKETGDVPDLSDNPRFTVRRALVLLLLRGSLEAVINTSTDRSGGILKVGEGVRLLAMCLAASRVGLRSLPVTHKTGDGLPAGLMLRELGRILLHEFAISSGTTMPPTRPSLDTLYQKHGELDGSWILLLGGREFSRKQARFDPDLQRLFHHSRALEYDTSEHEEGLIVLVHLDGEENQQVYLRLVAVGGKFDQLVRFESAVLTKARGIPLIASKLKKSALLDMLMANADEEIQCRFSVRREDGSVVVITDQLLHTLDDDEFHQHVMAVAKVASKFSKP
jgi:hypothetical protein